jgi:hypothetical protein
MAFYSDADSEGSNMYEKCTITTYCVPHSESCVCSKIMPFQSYSPHMCHGRKKSMSV